MDLLSCQALTKTYSSGDSAVHAVSQVDLTFRGGEFVAITGPSGSGKSTLLHMLGGLEYPTSARYSIKAQICTHIMTINSQSSGGADLDLLFQAYNLVRELTGYENILLPVMLDHRKPDEQYISRVIDMLDIGDRVDHLPGAMSGGQQQRISLARALANKPSVLFADEPTGNLDGHAGREVLSLMRYVSHELGVTLIMVTHDLAIAEQSQRIIRIEDGA